MANIILPERFETKLKQHQALDGIVKTVLSSFGDIYEDNKLYFFQEYTGHGIKHIQDVISSTDNLITEKTFTDILKPNDIAYYILSVILHDIGMHINLDGFELLVNGDFDDVQVKEIDTNTWSELWEDFLNEAKKFSGKQLKSIFGSEETIIRIPPFSNRGQISEDDKKLIGEFIRRNHPRLAHEISLKGFPGKPSILLFANGLEISIRNMIGLIARSHGMSLRKCLDYLENTYGKSIRRTPNSTHATYLMILLRIADYIQIDSTRTSKTILKLKTFSSPLSEIEHQTHLAIDDVDDKYQDDPERMFVNASPKDSRMFLKIKKLIKSIQYEFDISWAVLGELYGTIEAKPEIKYRRITSNLEEELFILRQPYIADSFSFKANHEIIKLLIKPLYGNDASYGVRELLQNAIDASKERQEIERKKCNDTYTPIVEIEIVKVEDGSYFIIKDNGIGMDLDIIKNYFLSAGASFRKSIEWQKEFLDINGNAIVRRSGRFGIGILAAFLIGKEIYVETKKIGYKTGYKFSADLNIEQINVVKDDSISEGTLIKIGITEEIINYFNPENDKTGFKWFQWFTLCSPKTVISYLGKEIIPYPRMNPDLDQELPLDWNAIDSPGFNKILWTYSNDYINKNFTCNGIVIPQNQTSFRDILILNTTNNPKISIFDNNAFTPLTLNRDFFTDKLTFSEELMKDIYKDFIAYFLVKKDISKVVEEQIYLLTNRLDYPAFKSQYEYGGFWYGHNVYVTNVYNHQLLNNILIAKGGFILNYNYFIRKLNQIDAVLIQSEDSAISESFINLDIQNRFVNFSTEKLNSIGDYSGAIDAQQYNKEKGAYDLFNSIIYIKEEKYKYLFNASSKRMTVWLQNKCKINCETDGWTCLHLDNPKDALISKEFLKEYSNKINFIREYEIICPHKGYSILDELLEKYIGDDVIIPYEIEERKKKFPLAFLDLERYMKKYIF